MKKTIYELELHEELNIDSRHFDVVVSRVPGGWIYTNYVKGTIITGGTFVPFKKSEEDNC